MLEDIFGFHVDIPNQCIERLHAGAYSTRIKIKHRISTMSVVHGLIEEIAAFLSCTFLINSFGKRVEDNS